MTITGTNFREFVLDYDIPQTARTLATVQVTFNGRAARRVDVLSNTELRVLTPRYWHADPRVDAFPAINVVVTNLDDDSVAILGETVAETGGFTYKRWELGAPRPHPATLRILEELMWALSIEVERNTYFSTHVDYGEEGLAIIIDEAKLPSINLTVTIEDDKEYAVHDNYPEEIAQNDGSSDTYEGGRTVQLVLDVLCAGEGGAEALHLCGAVQDFVQVNPELRCSTDPVLYPGEEDDYPVEIWQDPRQVGTPGESGMAVFSMQLRVRGIRTLPDAPTGKVQTIETFTLTEKHLDATGVEDGVAVHTDLVEP